MPSRRIDPRISTAMRTTAVPVDELRLWDRNPHTGDVEVARTSIRRFGQVKPIVRAPDGWIVAGNTTLKAMIAEGFATAATVTLDADEEELIAYGLADNQTARLGIDDDTRVYELLRQIGEFEGTGYTPDDFDDLRIRMEEMEAGEQADRPFFNPDTGLRGNEPSMDGYLDGYQAHSIRAVILNYDLTLFAWVQTHAAALRSGMGLDTNAELFAALIGTAVGETPPPIVTATVADVDD